MRNAGGSGGGAAAVACGRAGGRGGRDQGGGWQSPNWKLKTNDNDE
jgi:hypothetical protein